MKTNKKYWKLLAIDDQLYFGVETSSARAAKDFVTNHLPTKAVKSALKACCTELWGIRIHDAYFKLKYACGLEFKKHGSLYITKL